MDTLTLTQERALYELMKLSKSAVNAQEVYLDRMEEARSETSKDKLMAGLRYNFGMVEALCTSQKAISDGCKFSPEWTKDTDDGEWVLTGITVHLPEKGPLSFNIYHVDDKGRVFPLEDNPEAEAASLTAD